VTALDPEISYKIHTALANAMQEEDGSMLLSRWIVMAEHVFEGGTSVAYVTSPGLSTWEVLGMVDATKLVAEEHLIAQYAEDDEEDDE